MSLAWSGVLELDPGTGRRPCSRPTTALRRSRYCLVVSDILLELDKYFKTDENEEIGFETSVFCTKNKTTRQCFTIQGNNWRTKNRKWKWQFLLPDRTCLIQLLQNSFPIVQCFVSIPGAQLVGFPTTSGGKKSNHLVGSSASGQKSDHLVGNLTTLCSKKKISKLKRGGLGPAKSIV